MTIDCGLVFSSIGNRGRPLEAVPFDTGRGVGPNRHGRVEDQGALVEGLYVTGWLKRGPTGVIGTNRADSIETVRQVLEELASPGLKPKQGRDVFVASLARKGVSIVGLQDWLKIDAVERARGQKASKPREKLTRVSEMLNIVSPDRVHEPADSAASLPGR
jgi:ferredoxin/flavodoxin---NADP+ reductase